VASCMHACMYVCMFACLSCPWQFHVSAECSSHAAAFCCCSNRSMSSVACKMDVFLQRAQCSLYASTCADNVRPKLHVHPLVSRTPIQIRSRILLRPRSSLLSLSSVIFVCSCDRAVYPRLKGAAEAARSEERMKTAEAGDPCESKDSCRVSMPPATAIAHIVMPAGLTR
jgi:hypothetical protein